MIEVCQRMSEFSPFVFRRDVYDTRIRRYDEDAERCVRHIIQHINNVKGKGSCIVPLYYWSESLEKSKRLIFTIKEMLDSNEINATIKIKKQNNIYSAIIDFIV